MLLSYTWLFGIFQGHSPVLDTWCLHETTRLDVNLGSKGRRGLSHRSFWPVCPPDTSSELRISGCVLGELSWLAVRSREVILPLKARCSSAVNCNQTNSTEVILNLFPGAIQGTKCVLMLDKLPKHSSLMSCSTPHLETVIWEITWNSNHVPQPQTCW